LAEVVVGASRHIISTAATTFGGFLPLILAGGGFWPPFATAIAGGVLLSPLLAFWFTPPMFKLLRRRGVGTQASASAPMEQSGQIKWRVHASS
jgi:multidrug efflux pump subunit AcrB